MEVVVTSDSNAEHWCAASWDPKTGSLLTNYKHAAPIGSRTLQVLSDSYLLGADSTKPRLYIWPLNSQRPVPNLRLTPPGRVSALACTSNGSYIVLAVSEKLYVWQLCNGRLLATITRHYQTVTCLAFSKDGSIFVSGGEDGLLYVWSLFRAINEEEVNPIYSYSDHTLPVKDLCIGHCGPRARLCSVSLDRTANIYDLNGGTLLVSLVFDQPLTSVCINARESELFVGSTDGLIFKFDLRDPPRAMEHHVSTTTENNDGCATYRRHEAAISSLSVSTDCRYLLSASLDGKAYMWDVVSRQILMTFTHKGQVTNAFFVPKFDNFRMQNLRPSLRIQPLQRVVDDSKKENIIDVIRRGRDTSDILNFESYIGKDSAKSYFDDDSSQKLDNATEEIEKLKKINATLYKYTVECILRKSTSKQLD